MSALLIAALLAASPQATTESNATPDTSSPPPAARAAPSANAASITLEEARREGRSNTQALLSLLDLERAEQDVRLARAPLFPQLDFSVNAGGVAAGTQSIVTPLCDATGTNCVQQEVEVPGSSRGNYSISLTVNQIIYDRARWKQLAQSGAAAEAQRGQTRDQEDASELEAINRFYNLYRSQATIQVLEATVRRSEQQLERARALFQAGRVGRGEELTALVNLGNDRITLMQRRGQLALDQSQLATWIARPGPQPLVAQDPGLRDMELGPIPSLEAAIAEARGRRPLIHALQEQVRAAQLAQEASRSDYYPRLVAQGSYTRAGPTPGPVFTEPRLQNQVTGAVVLQWDLFSGLATQAQVSRAAASVRTAELNLAQAERELDGTVRSSIETLAANIEATRLAAANREVAAQSLALAEERFKAGAGSTLEVRDAQLSLTRAELALLENRVSVEVARFALMRAMGTLSSGESK